MSFSKKPKRINPDDVDPSIYCYDEVYDEMKNEEEDKSKLTGNSGATSKQGPKYIKGLIETAERRNTEKNLRKFKKFTKEREEAQAVGELNDEEVFISSGYKKKLEEMKVLEEETMRRLRDEETSSMNFVKQANKKVEHRSKQEPRNFADQVTKITAQSSTPVETQNITPITLIEDPVDEKNKSTPEESKSLKPKKFKTKEERRAYLERILAKRTVGKLFDEAVARYQMRKLQAKT